MSEHEPFAVQLTRTFPVSIDRLYAAWTDNSQLERILIDLNGGS